MSEDLKKFFEFLNTTEGKTWADNRANPQQSLGGPVVSEGNKWGIGAQGGVVWNGASPAPTGDAAQRQIEELLRGSLMEGSRFTVNPDGTTTMLSGGDPNNTASQRLGATAGTPTAGGTSNEDLKKFLEYLAGRAGNANPVVGQAHVQPAYTPRPGGPQYGAVTQKGLL